MRMQVSVQKVGNSLIKSAKIERLFLFSMVCLDLCFYLLFNVLLE